MTIHRDGPRGYTCGGEPDCPGCLRELAILNHMKSAPETFAVPGEQHDVPKPAARWQTIALVFVTVVLVLREVWRP